MERIELHAELRRLTEIGDQRGALELLHSDKDARREFQNFFRRRFPLDWEDVYSDYVVRSLASIERAKLTAHVMGWAWGVARNTALNEIRIRGRGTARVRDMREHASAWMSGGRLGTSRTLQSLREELGRLSVCLSTASRAVLWVRWRSAIDGVVPPMSEVARATGLTTKQVFEKNRKIGKVGAVIRQPAEGSKKRKGTNG